MITTLIALLFSWNAQAYPEFIGYSYTTCVTCHNNGLGGGALNDYGRALWSAEIASRAFYSESTSDEQLGEKSGFLGHPENTPWWLKPSVKYRGLWQRKNPGSSEDQQKFYHMQVDAGLAVALDPDAKYLITATWGYRPNAADVGTNRINRFLAKEYYFRVGLSETWWLYGGLMDIAYGLRNVDHTSLQRAPQEMRYYDQSQGLILQHVADEYEVSLNAFTGSPELTEQIKRKGFSMQSEFTVGEDKRFGVSGYSDKNDFRKKNMYAIHYRQQLSKGSSLLFEYGFIEEKPVLTDSTFGSYTFVQSQVLLTRGYSLRGLIERYNREFKPSSPEDWRWGIGLLAFPMARLEFRVDALNKRQIVNTNASDDEWNLRVQTHVSL
jgi:hypothetical protein